MLRLVAIAVVGLAVGCSRGPAEKQVQHFQDLILLHFSNLNNEAELAKIEAKTVKGADAPMTVGRQFSTYTWHPGGFILDDIECPRCKTVHLIVTYRAEQVLCSSCGSYDGKENKTDPLIRGGLQLADLESAFKGQVKQMFEARADAGKDKVAIIRYVRRHWLMDERGRVEVSAKAAEKFPLGTLAQREGRDGAKNYYGGDFHRLDATFVGTTAFLYNGTISQIDAKSVGKMLKNEPTERKSWKFGSTLAVEEPVRPWNQPATLDSPKMKPQ